ncbi:MAG TPA: hypothetical protein VH724_15385 [Candidatus Angelobacter sp.]|nr:hypothetical protein [Candidatus Angelobacter sp.]
MKKQTREKISAAAEEALSHAPWIHLKDAAVLFGVSFGHAQNLVYQGKFPVPTQMLGRHRIVFKAVIAKYFQDQEKKALQSLGK